MKCHMKHESVFPVTFPGQKPRGNIIFFAVFQHGLHLGVGRSQIEWKLKAKTQIGRLTSAR